MNGMKFKSYNKHFKKYVDLQMKISEIKKEDFTFYTVYQSFG